MGYRFSRARRPVVIMGDDSHFAIRLGWDFQWEHEQGLSPEFVRAVSGGKVEHLALGEHCAIDKAPGAFAAGDLYGPWTRKSSEYQPGQPERRPFVDPGALRLNYLAFGVLPPPAEVTDYFRGVWEREGPREPSGPAEVCWQPGSIVVWFPPGGVLRAKLVSAIFNGTAVVGLAEPIQRGHMKAPEPYIATSAEFAERVIA